MKEILKNIEQNNWNLNGKRFLLQILIYDF